MEYDIKYMRRAIQLAQSSKSDTHPNPNVGAVIVAAGRIIGEGYHRCCGQPHAEVNAVNSVAPADKHLLADSTIYVTLEPCSHYGKTPPCAKLIIDNKIPRVVIACGDPFEMVSGRGVQMLRDAGVEVVEGVLKEEAMGLNKHFFAAHSSGRPYITLKWAQSADGYMDVRRESTAPAFQFSTPLDATLVHRERALHDALLTTASTVIADNPRLDVRHWDGKAPRIVIVDRSGVIDGAVAARLDLFKGGDREILLLTSRPLQWEGVENVEIKADITPAEIMRELYGHGISSVLTECGPRMLQALIDAGLYDNVRVFTSTDDLGERGTAHAPTL